MKLPYLRHTATGFYVDVYVQPGARQNSLCGTFQDRLKIKVAAKAYAGKANKELCETLSKFLDVPKSSITLVRGEKSRCKTFFVGSNVAQTHRLLSQD